MNALLIPPPLLVVEDDEDVRELIVGLLEDEGYAITQAASLAEALARLRQQLFQGILTDLFATSPRQPWQSVQPLLREARPMPVGVLTSWNVTPEEITRRGFAFLIKKPFEVDELLEQVANVAHPTFPPAQQQQAQIIQHLVMALNQGDWPVLRSLLTEDTIYYLLRPRHPALPKAVQGRERVIAFVQGWLERVPDWQLEGFQVFRGRPDMGARFQWSLPGWMAAGSAASVQPSSIFRASASTKSALR